MKHKKKDKKKAEKQILDRTGGGGAICGREDEGPSQCETGRQRGQGDKGTRGRGQKVKKKSEREQGDGIRPWLFHSRQPMLWR